MEVTREVDVSKSTLKDKIKQNAASIYEIKESAAHQTQKYRSTRGAIIGTQPRDFSIVEKT